MKGLRFGLMCGVVGAALATMAFGTGSASAATVICETPTSTCSSPYLASSKFEVVGTANLKGFPSLVTCGLDWEFEIGLNSMPVVQAKVLRWEMTACSGGHIVKPIGLFWPMRLTTTSGGDGTAELEPRVLHRALEVDGCIYERGILPMGIEGGGWITDSGVVLTSVFTSSCPTTLTLSIPSSKPIPMFWMEN
jgi:hypothetical protein